MIRYLLILLVWGLGAAFVYWKSGGDWQAVLAIATWFLVLGVVYAFLQVRQTRRSTNAQLAVALFEKLREEQTKNNLRFIYELRREDIQNLCRSDIHNIDAVLDKFELLGTLVAQGIIDKRLAIEAFAGTSALRCWYQLAEYVKEERKKRGFFLDNYEAFARLSLDYFKDANIKVWFHGQGKKRTELVFDQLQKCKLRPRSFKEIRRERKTKRDKFKKLILSVFFYSNTKEKRRVKERLK